MSLISQFYNHPQEVIEYLITSTQTFTPISTGWHYFKMVAGGGSGAIVSTTTVGPGNYLYAVACGGNGGNYREGWVLLTGGVEYTITVGAGGAAVEGGFSTNALYTGSDGADTTITGTGLTSIICKRGKGGAGYLNEVGDPIDHTAATGTPLTTENAANDSGSGAGVETLGGKGGNVLFQCKLSTANDWVLITASGGGAANVRGTGADNCRGGNLTTDTDNFASGGGSATGGGGIKGSGGDRTDFNNESVTPISIGANDATGGGGTDGDGTINGEAGGAAATHTATFWNPTGAGGKGDFEGAADDGGDGAGGGAHGIDGSGGAYPAGDGGNFGGGGAIIYNGTSSSASMVVGAGGIGGGGGGYILHGDNGNQPYSGAGGAGYVYLKGFYSPSA